MLLHVVRETDAGIVVRGAKYETAAAYANQAFTKPTIANWGDAALFRLRGRVHLRSRLRRASNSSAAPAFAGRAPAEDYPLSNRFDEVDTLVIFDDVLIPWENVLFYRHTRAAPIIRATLHRYSAFAFVQRNLKLADMLIGAALFNVAPDRPRQAAGGAGEARAARGLPRGDQRAPDRGDRAGRAQPGGLMMPNQSLLYTGRVLACSQLHAMMHVARELCGGQICVTPDKAAFEDAGDRARG